MLGRPAESITAAAGLAYLIAYLINATDDTGLLVALGVVIAALPGAVTFLVNLSPRSRRAAAASAPTVAPSGSEPLRHEGPGS